MNFKTGALIAIAAGSLFAAACKKDESKTTPGTTEMKSGDSKAGDPSAAAPAGDEKMAKVHCAGVNECKGTGGCKTEANACAGQNGCKGKGWVEMAEADCKAKGGTVAAK